MQLNATVLDENNETLALAELTASTKKTLAGMDELI